MTDVGHASQSRTWSRSAATVLGFYVILGGITSFAGWAADLPRLTDWYNNGISIQPNATLAVTLAGAGLLALVAGYRWVTAVCGVVVASIGGSALFEWISGIDLGIDTLLMFERTWGRVGVVSPGRMGPPGATSWTLIGCALVLASRPTSTRPGAPALVLVTAAVSMLSIVGYLYGASALYQIPTVTVIAMQTATYIFAESVGVILALPGRGPMRLLADEGPAGVLVRRSIPGVVAVPIVLGLLRLAGERAGLYDLAFGTAARTVLEIVLLVALLWWTAQAISRQASARKEAEEVAAGRTLQLRTTLESITDGFVTLDSDWRFTYVNPAAQRFLLHSDQLLGRTIWEMFPEALNTRVEHALRHVAARGESVKFEAFSQRLHRWFSNNAYPTSEGGVSIYLQDITDKRKAEEEVAASQRQLESDLADTRVLQKLSAEIIGQDDAQALYTKLVEAAVRVSRSQFASIQMLDTDPSSGTGEGLRLLASHGFSDHATRAWHWITPASHTTCGQAMRTRERAIVEDVLTCEFIAGTADFDVFVETGIRSMQSTPLLSRTGVLLGVMSTHWREPHTPSDRELRLLDLLARQAADFIERRNNAESLKDADRRKDEFLVTLAHELRNPLAAIRSTVELFNRTHLEDAGLVRAREILDRHTTLMARLMDDLIDVGRVARDRLELRLQHVDLTSVIRGAVEMSTPLVEQLRHRVHVECADEPLIVHGDPMRLSQVIGNLINNACRYTDPGGSIRISARRDGGDAVVTVRDSGIGIAPKELSGIFEIFAQVDSSLERSQGGLGIGLHLAKRLIEMHGGRIRAESAGLGHGSSFTIWCPIVEGFVEAAQDEGPPPRSSLARPRRVLVVDDNRDGAEMLAGLLRMSQQETFLAHDGEAALAAAESLRPDAVLLDIGLPLMNGFEVCRRIREQPWGKEMIVIAVTGWGQDADRSRSRAAGFNHHLVKPIDHDVVMELLSSIPARTGSSA